MTKPSLSLAFLILCAGSTAWAASPERLDWDTWEHMPLLHDGRIKPVDTLARSVVQTICGRENPELSLAGALVKQDRLDGGEAQASEGVKQLTLDSPELAAARELLPGDGPRKFRASELLLSWVIEPEKWEYVPFLSAGNETLRTELLGLPITDREGRRLKHASPWQVANAPALRKRWDEIRTEQRKAEAEGKRFELTGVNRKVSELVAALAAFRSASFSPAREGERRRYVQQLSRVLERWRQIAPELERVPQPEEAAGHFRAAGEAITSLQSTIMASIHGESADWIPIEKLEPNTAKFCDAMAKVADDMDRYARRFASEPPSGWDPAQLEKAQVKLRGWASGTADLARLANEAHSALYDNGSELAVVPALNAAALEQNRDPDDDARPWLSLPTLLLGSDALLARYPQAELKEVRAAFDQVRTVYQDRQNSRRAELFGPAMERFVAAVRALGEQVEPLREGLPIRQRDQALIAATQYPAVGATNVEVRYNRLDLFVWTWSLALAGLALFGLGQVPVLRKPMFWSGLAMVAASQAFTIVGLGMRVYVTGRAPVTNMFETVVFVTLVVALLGLWFTLLPLFGRGLQHAWRLTAISGTWEAAALDEAQTRVLGPQSWSLGSLLLAVPRLLLAAAIFYALTMTGYGSERSYVSLVPKTMQVSDLIVWGVGLCVLAIALYYVPRIVLSLVSALVMVPRTLIKEGAARPLEQVLARRAFAVAGAAVAFFAAYLAYFVPGFDRNIFDKHINPLMPVLRDNFWLTTHVLTITASYGAGLLAWGLGNIALACYLLGRYRRFAGAETGQVQVRPPEVCTTLGSYVYKASQVAVLLLAAGTILGALWADVSWGRFWGWDPKEVWALIALFIYLAVLHGRYAGLFGNFGLAIGSVIGQTSILMAWYGVNFVLGSGLHTYGDGAGGKWWVFAFIGLNWLFAAAAAGRYVYEAYLAAPRQAVPGDRQEITAVGRLS